MNLFFYTISQYIQTGLYYPNKNTSEVYRYATPIHFMETDTPVVTVYN